MKKIIIIGQMDNTIDHTFESANRVYDGRECCPTIPTCGGGGIQPKVIKKRFGRKWTMKGNVKIANGVINRK